MCTHVHQVLINIPHADGNYLFPPVELLENLFPPISRKGGGNYEGSEKLTIGSVIAVSLKSYRIHFKLFTYVFEFIVIYRGCKFF